MKIPQLAFAFAAPEAKPVFPLANVDMYKSARMNDPINDKVCK